MSKRKLVIILAAVLVCIAAAGIIVYGFVSGSGSESFALEDDAKNMWLDRYEEKNVPMKSGDPAKLNWKSSDKKIVTVENGRLSAQGVGKAVVTVSSGKHKETISVQVSDSGSLPEIDCKDFDAYQDAEIEIPAKIKYNGEITDIVVAYTADISDTSVAKFADGKIRGITLGETDAIIKAEYKGLHLEKRVKITVKENSFVEFEVDEIEIYNAKDNPKLNCVALTPTVVKNGKILEDPDLVYEATEGADYVAIEGNKITAAKEGTAQIKATYTDKNTTMSGTVTVKVKSNWVAASFVNTSTYSITWQPASGTVGGRTAADTDMMEYRAADEPGISYYEFRVTGSDTGTLISDLYRKGYRYFAYDVYYGSNANMMVGAPYEKTVTVGEYFRRDYATVLRDENGDGKLERTNRLDKNAWVTLVFDLYALIEEDPEATSGFFFTVNDSTTTSYVMNVRYYLDDTFLPEENLVYTDKGDYIQATEDEFGVFIPVSQGYAGLNKTGKYEAEIRPGEKAEYGPINKKIGGRTGVYRYQANLDSPWRNSLVVASSMNKSLEAGMLKLSKRGRYLVFDMYIENADVIDISINHTGHDVKISLGKTDLSKYAKWLNFYKDGKLQYTIEEGRWYTVSIGYIDGYLPEAWKSTILLAGCNKGDVFYIDDVRYYKNGDFLPTKYEGVAPPKGMEVLHPDTELVTVASGPFANTAKFTSKSSGLTWDNHWASIRFTDVSEQHNKDGGHPVKKFFKRGYKYVKMDLYLAENTQGIGFFSFQTNKDENYEGVKHSGELLVGESNFSMLLFDAATKEYATKLESNKWYTLFIPVEYNYRKLPLWVLTEFRSIGGSEEKPAVVYIKNLECTKTAYNIADILIAPKLTFTKTLLQIQSVKNVKTELIVNHDESNPIAVNLEPSGIAYEGFARLNEVADRLKMGENTLTVRLTDGKKKVETSIPYEYTSFLYVKDDAHTLTFESDAETGEKILKFTESGATSTIWNGVRSKYIADDGYKDGGYVADGVKYITMEVKLLNATGIMVSHADQNYDTEFKIWRNLDIGQTSDIIDNNGVQGTVVLNEWMTIKIPLSQKYSNAKWRDFYVRPKGNNTAMYIRNVKYCTDEYVAPSDPLITQDPLNAAIAVSGQCEEIRIRTQKNISTTVIVNGDTEHPISVSMTQKDSGYEGLFQMKDVVNRLKLGENIFTVCATDGTTVYKKDVTYENTGFLYMTDGSAIEIVTDSGTNEQVLKVTGHDTKKWQGLGSKYIAYNFANGGGKTGSFALDGIKYLTMDVRLANVEQILVKHLGPYNTPDIAKYLTVGTEGSSWVTDATGAPTKLECDKWVTLKISLDTGNGVITEGIWRQFYIEAIGKDSAMYIKNVRYITEEEEILDGSISVSIAESNTCESVRIVARDNMSTKLVVNGEEDPINITLKQEGTTWTAVYELSRIINRLKLGDNTITVICSKDGKEIRKNVIYNNTGFLYVKDGKHTLTWVTDSETGEMVLKFTETGATSTIWNGVRSKYIAYDGYKGGGYVGDGIKYILMEVKLSNAEGIMVSHADQDNDTEYKIWRNLTVGQTSDIIDNNGVQGTVVLDEWMTLKIPLSPKYPNAKWKEFYVRPRGNNGTMYIRNVQYCTDEYVTSSTSLMRSMKTDSLFAKVFILVKKMTLDIWNL